MTGAPALSWDGTTLYCYWTRPGHFGVRDLCVTARARLRNDEADEVDPGTKANPRTILIMLGSK